LSSNPKRILVGVINGVHGIRGSVTIKSFTEPPGNIFNYTSLQFESGQHASVKMLHLKKNDVYVASIAGISDRSSAELLKKNKLYITADELDESSDDGYFHHNIIGLKVVDSDGNEYGAVLAIQNHGASDIFEIKGEKIYLLPFIKDAVLKIDEQTVTINPNFLTQ
jgi:16S rRNA processing protein RimM